MSYDQIRNLKSWVDPWAVGPFAGKKGPNKKILKKIANKRKIFIPKKSILHYLMHAFLKIFERAEFWGSTLKELAHHQWVDPSQNMVSEPAHGPIGP